MMIDPEDLDWDGLSDGSVLGHAMSVIPQALDEAMWRGLITDAEASDLRDYRLPARFAADPTCVIAIQSAQRRKRLDI